MSVHANVLLLHRVLIHSPYARQASSKSRFRWERPLEAVNFIMQHGVGRNYTNKICPPCHQLLPPCWIARTGVYRLGKLPVKNSLLLLLRFWQCLCQFKNKRASGIFACSCMFIAFSFLFCLSFTAPNIVLPLLNWWAVSASYGSAAYLKFATGFWRAVSLCSLIVVP